MEDGSPLRRHREELIAKMRDEKDRIQKDITTLTYLVLANIALTMAALLLVLLR